MLLRQESSDRAPAFPELGLSASEEPAEKFPKKHRRGAKSNYFCRGQIPQYLSSGDALGALCVTHTRGSCSGIRAVLAEEDEVPAVSLNGDGAGEDELSPCFPSLDATGTFCSAPIPHLLHHIPLPVLLLFLCSAGLSHWAAASSEPALGGSLGSGEATGKVFSGLRCVMDGGGFGDVSSSTVQCGHS